ncbi:uncharacterized protein [Setaria viridis]|uniref:uncharacterized protein n=1 Tax=Setaria viridis TaxID=4556 RepID=UPI0014935BC0|nr:uncharacterized protein LOC117849112 [Setaria viridis]
MPITFSREDHWVHIPDPRSYLLAPTIDIVLLSKVVIDGGNDLNIIFTETLKRMDFNFERLLPCEDPFFIIPGKGSYPIGRVIVPITFDTLDNYRTEHLTFKVASFKTSYHAIFGRPMLASVLSIFGDVETSYKCDTEAVQLAETLEYSANANIMLAESKEVDQSQLTILEADPTPMALQPNPQVKKINLSLENPSKTARIESSLTPK